MNVSKFKIITSFIFLSYTTSTFASLESVNCSANNEICAAVGNEIVESLDAGVTWQLRRKLHLHNLASVNCFGTGNAAQCSAVGTHLGTLPLLYHRDDRGFGWRHIRSPHAIGDLNSVSCTDEGNQSLCIAVGDGIHPILFRSNNGGSIWDELHTNFNGKFNSVHCTGNGANSRCLVAGYNADGKPLLIEGYDFGRVWNEIQLPNNAPMYGSFNAIDCTGVGANTLCVAVGWGKNSEMHDKPIIMQSGDTGQTWSMVDLQLPDGYLTSINCTGISGQSICVTGGKNIENNTPLLVDTQNGGELWKERFVTNVVINGGILAVSCSSKFPDAICTAVGQNADKTAFILQSFNSSENWLLQSIPSIKGKFRATYCTSNVVNGFCVAVGHELDKSHKYKSLVAVSNNNNPGVWEIKNLRTCSKSLNR